jgi:uncharacterized repeat protein (TIGR01451 family)
VVRSTKLGTLQIESALEDWFFTEKCEAMRGTPVIFAVAMAATCHFAVGQEWFADDFSDGVIDPAHWVLRGDGITESGGVLNLSRDRWLDAIWTTSVFSGDWVVELDIRLNEIDWNDMFHGIWIRNERTRVGVGFGFSRYGKLFRSQHLPGEGVSFSYGRDGTNTPGVWQHWRLEKVGHQLMILVDGAPVPNDWGGQPLGGSLIHDNSMIRFPGYYDDGDGAAGAGATSSTIDNVWVYLSGSSRCDLELNKQAVAAGDTGFFTIQVLNHGPDSASGVVVTDTLPPGVTYLSDDCGAEITPPWTWFIGDLPVGTTASCEVEVTVLDFGETQNSALVTFDGFDPNPDNNGASATLARAREIPVLGGVAVVIMVLLIAGSGVSLMRRLYS